MERSAFQQATDRFLEGVDVRSIEWAQPTGVTSSIRTSEVLFGLGDKPLEVAVALSESPPRSEDLRKLWRTRGNSVAPVLLVVLYPAAGEFRAAVAGPSQNSEPITNLPAGRVERVCIAALAEPNAIIASATVERLLGSVSREGLAAGLLNSGLFATHELREGVPQRGDWESAISESLPLLGKMGRELLELLGYQIETRGSSLIVLSDKVRNTAVAVVLDDAEDFDRTSRRFGGVSPVSLALAQAQRERLPWVIALRKSQIRLYPASTEVGVGRKGLTETFVELDLAMLDESEAGYLSLLFSPDALGEEGTVSEILAASAQYATGLGARLRARIYEDVVPNLAVAVGKRLGSKTDEELATAYHYTLVILFRLLFIAYAEDRGLLPYQQNDLYTRNALNTYARDFIDHPEREFSPDSQSVWDDLVQVWRVVDSGDPAWDVPAYNGGLFSADPELHPEGAAVNALNLKNSEIGPALKALMVDIDVDGSAGPVDFRSLTVREFGTIYEGLLESSLSVAPMDLALDKDSTYVPAKDASGVVVPAGTVYFHNASGQRKATGSYFTKAFAVSHLLDKALEPALDGHLSKVKALIAEGEVVHAADLLFDFRVADLAMGSGHFLVAAIDRIEARFSAFLTENPLAPVSDELLRLEQTARKALGDRGEAAMIEPSLLLRRQIARRCIYGLDINLVAVELARLAIWIHTFVPGLPMSSLDHGLVHGNSLTGVGTVGEVLAALAPSDHLDMASFVEEPLRALLDDYRDVLVRVARASEATKREVREAETERSLALEAALPAKKAMDLAVAVRLGLLSAPIDADDAFTSIDSAEAEEARSVISLLAPAHLPYLFPEVFLRERPGFDVVLGNPPWEKLHVEVHAWWGLRYPGLRGLPSKQRDDRLKELPLERPDLALEYDLAVQSIALLRDAVQAVGYPGIGSGHLDLYKAFAWRDWDVIRPGGRMGVVFPRAILTGSGTSQWREAVLTYGSFEDVLALSNSAQWVFEGVDGRYSIALVSVHKSEDSTSDRVVRFSGPFHSYDEYLSGRGRGIEFAAEEFATYGCSAAFPLLPTAETARVFQVLRSSPSFDTRFGGELRPVQGDLNATTNKTLLDFDLENPTGDIRVLGGSSFHLWNPDFGAPYAFAEQGELEAHLRQKLSNQVRRADGAFSGMRDGDDAELPMHRSRIAFRDVTNQTNQRTVIPCLLPAGVALTHKAPYLLRRDTEVAAEAYVLGVFSSIPFDWYARRFVELNLTFQLLQSFPVPLADSDTPIYRRLVEISARLASPDDRFAEWREQVGAAIGVDLGAPAVLTGSEKDDLIYELDALVSLLYGLSEDDVSEIFRTFHRGWDYAGRLDRVLHFMQHWDGAAVDDAKMANGGHESDG